MNYKHLNNLKDKLELFKLMDTLNVVAIFQKNNPHLKQYTWRKNTIKQARIDIFLISESLQTMFSSIQCENSYRSDHSPGIFKCKLNQFVKGEEFWKFYNILLTDNTYVDILKYRINQIQHQYACYVYNRDKIPSTENENLSFIISDQPLLDLLLMKIREKSISFLNL